MCSAHPLMMFYIREKFLEYISKGFQLIERTQVHNQNGYVQCTKGNNSKSRQTRSTIHEFCTLSHGALNLFDVSSKYLKQFPTYSADTSSG